MKSVLNKSIFTLMLAATLFTSCVNDDDYATPALNCAETILTPNLEPQEIPATEIAAKYSGPAGGIIQAYVVSSDVEGNFFKSISLQTLDGSFGFSIPADVTSLFRKMEPGRMVFIKLDSTYTDIKYGSMRIGALYNNEVGRLSPADFKEIVFPSCKIVDEEELVKKLSIEEAMKDVNVNTLIELEKVEFANEAVYKTYFDPANQIGGATNHYLEDSSGNRIIFRTSEFTDYAGKIVPEKSGSVRGVLTKYREEYQFIPRGEADIKLTEDRFGDPVTPPAQPGESETAVGGTDIVFSGTLTEDFESYDITNTLFSKYVNDNTLGNRYWQVRQSNNNKFIEMTSFSGTNNPGVEAKSYFIIPVDFTAANNFSFSKQIMNMKGQSLKVYYVAESDYTARFPIDNSKFVDITNNFTELTYPDTDKSQSTFTTAGTYNIPGSLTGNGFFVLEYTGTSTITTTIQIDDILIN